MDKEMKTALVHIAGSAWAVLSICWAVEAEGIVLDLVFAILAGLGFFVSAVAFEYQRKED